MKLTKRLLSYLHRVFDKSPEQFLALRVRCDGTALVWAVADAVLTLTPSGGTAQVLVVNLRDRSIMALATLIAQQPGYSVAYVDGSQAAQLSSAVLIEGTGNTSASNGDHLYGYTSVLWSYMEANAVELNAAEKQIGNMLQQMATTTAEDIWLDELGSYYKVPRNQGELDAQYGPRIIAQVLRPLANNVAIENALRIITKKLPVEVKDYETIVNGSYGLFDVSLELGLESLETKAYAALLLSIIETIDLMRDAGTFLRHLALVTRVQSDIFIGATAICGETVIIGNNMDLVYDGFATHDGTFTYAGVIF